MKRVGPFPGDLALGRGAEPPPVPYVLPHDHRHFFLEPVPVAQHVAERGAAAAPPGDRVQEVQLAQPAADGHGDGLGERRVGLHPSPEHDARLAAVGLRVDDAERHAVDAPLPAGQHAHVVLAFVGPASLPVPDHVIAEAAVGRAGQVHRAVPDPIGAVGRAGPLAVEDSRGRAALLLREVDRGRGPLQAGAQRFGRDAVGHEVEPLPRDRELGVLRVAGHWQRVVEHVPRLEAIRGNRQGHAGIVLLEEHRPPRDQDEPIAVPEQTGEQVLVERDVAEILRGLQVLGQRGLGSEEGQGSLVVLPSVRRVFHPAVEDVERVLHVLDLVHDQHLEIRLRLLDGVAWGLAGVVAHVARVGGMGVHGRGRGDRGLRVPQRQHLAVLAHDRADAAHPLAHGHGHAAAHPGPKVVEVA